MAAQQQDKPDGPLRGPQVILSVGPHALNAVTVLREVVFHQEQENGLRNLNRARRKLGVRSGSMNLFLDPRQADLEARSHARLTVNPDIAHLLDDSVEVERPRPVPFPVSFVVTQGGLSGPIVSGGFSSGWRRGRRGQGIVCLEDFLFHAGRRHRSTRSNVGSAGGCG